MHFLWGVLGAPEPRLENNKLRENEAKNHKTITTKMMAVHSMSVLVFVVVVLSNSIKATEPPVPQPSAAPLPLPKFLPQLVSQSFHLSHCLPLPQPQPQRNPYLPSPASILPALSHFPLPLSHPFPLPSSGCECHFDVSLMAALLFRFISQWLWLLLFFMWFFSFSL